MLFTVPVPPSTNHLFANIPGKGRVKSAEYKQWISTAGWLAKTATVGRPALKRCAVTYRVPENGRRDLDNYAKPLGDMLQAVGVIENDKHIRKIVIEWWEGDQVQIEIEERP